MSSERSSRKPAMGLEVWFKWESTCLSSMRPSVQSTAKKKKKQAKVSESQKQQSTDLAPQKLQIWNFNYNYKNHKQFTRNI
jgi:predicted Zn-dependent protease